MKEVKQVDFITFINSRTKGGDADMKFKRCSETGNKVFETPEDGVIATAYDGKYFIKEHQDDTAKTQD